MTPLEDKFDLTQHKKAACAAKYRKQYAQRARRQIKFGKALLAISAFVLFFLLFYLANNVMMLF
ncbi:MAG: hypothetical protein FWC78_00360 [Defluviitaleaceae bacterium]|nr:hypothetical protein [Defluviitaleaceae bacterium]